jgi:hypothetical protein
MNNVTVLMNVHLIIIVGMQAMMMLKQKVENACLFTPKPIMLSLDGTHLT